MRIQISQKEIKEMLDKQFGEGNFYDLSFMESDFALRQRLGEGRYEREIDMPHRNDGMRAIFENMMVLVSTYVEDLEIINKKK